MIEMQRKHSRLFSNELPKWALVLHIGLISLFFLIALASLLVLVINPFSEEESGLLVLFGILIILFTWLGRFAYKNLRLYTKLRMSVELRKDGYFYSYKNQMTKEEKTCFLPFADMDSLLIGMDYQQTVEAEYRPSRPNAKIVFYQVAKLLISGKSSEGKDEVLFFTLSDAPTVNEWLSVFEANQVRIYCTDQALSAAIPEKEWIEEVPKYPYAGKLSFEIGKKADQLDKVFFSQEQQLEREQQSKKSRKRGFLLLSILGMFQIFMVRYWFIDWPIDDGTFSDDSGMGSAWLFTLLALAVITFLIKQQGFLDLLKAVAALFLSLTIGLLWVLASVRVPDGFAEAVYFYGILVSVIYVPVALFMIIRRSIRQSYGI
ncbi:hypothetical protein NDK47_04965 [Brevibacillus ruminantium]|uniref:Uncharacterized protein n=1 Tax=Brevibacillus ruminantium TaxID=2950604 RepID=A0ABY4WIF2_9BACL|nr:hypothetical protein [Brevibacillus ruminantium]USG66654.1 hypothetical protein NDK47_04965 [Brevibacillus ruminantium]